MRSNKRRRVDMTNQLDLFTSEPESPAANPTGLAAAILSPQPTPAAKALPPRLRLVRTTAHEIADKIDVAWNGQHLGNDITVPMGVIAALALLGQTAMDGRDTARHVLSLGEADLIAFYKEIWGHTWMMDPYLASCTYPLWEWLLAEQVPPKVVTAVHVLTRTAITAGLLTLTGDADPIWRCEQDVLGALLTTLRSRGKRDALAEFHTPPELANLIARMAMLELPEPGACFDDPAAGTGGLIRAAALTLRLQGRNPREYGWSMGDIDPLAAACCAVNAIVWSLGPSVLVFCGDTLATGNGPDRAAAHRRQAWKQHRELVRDITAVNKLKLLGAA
ncbi:N-6 DNA methylase [Streptosporangium canum]|uniref:N-6 DNA methylase n=1 Tax=Streptosporangium canum TaxID=324952 RepID=UPI0036C04C7C